MKRIFLLTILLGVVSAMAQEQPAPNAAAAATEPTAKAEQAPVQDMLPNQRAFLNLAEERRKDFIKHLNEANRLFQQKRIFETLEQLQKAEIIFNESPEIFNLRGSCYVEMRAFDMALEDFNKALTLSEANPSIRFNIAEV